MKIHPSLLSYAYHANGQTDRQMTVKKLKTISSATNDGDNNQEAFDNKGIN